MPTSHLIIAKRNVGRAQCLWCGRGAYARDCLTEDVRTAICQYAFEHGRSWKSQLAHDWAAGRDLGPALQQARNIAGPSGIKRISASMIRRHLESVRDAASECEDWRQVDEIDVQLCQQN